MKARKAYPANYNPDLRTDWNAIDQKTRATKKSGFIFKRIEIEAKIHPLEK
jgi:hypothetical protein